jgi:uncharacterized membrane protein YgcG
MRTLITPSQHTTASQETLYLLQSEIPDTPGEIEDMLSDSAPVSDTPTPVIPYFSEDELAEQQAVADAEARATAKALQQQQARYEAIHNGAAAVPYDQQQYLQQQQQQLYGVPVSSGMQAYGAPHLMPQQQQQQPDFYRQQQQLPQQQVGYPPQQQQQQYMPQALQQTQQQQAFNAQLQLQQPFGAVPPAFYPPVGAPSPQLQQQPPQQQPMQQYSEAPLHGSNGSMQTQYGSADSGQQQQQQGDSYYDQQQQQQQQQHKGGRSDSGHARRDSSGSGSGAGGSAGGVVQYNTKCMFWGVNNRRCRAGDSCKFIHDDNHVPSMSANRGRGRWRGGSSRGGGSKGGSGASSSRR